MVKSSFLGLTRTIFNISSIRMWKQNTKNVLVHRIPKNVLVETEYQKNVLVEAIIFDNFHLWVSILSDFFFWRWTFRFGWSNLPFNMLKFEKVVWGSHIPPLFMQECNQTSIPKFRLKSYCKVNLLERKSCRINV